MYENFQAMISKRNLILLILILNKIKFMQR